MIKSFIVQKDENTLIVSQHIPQEYSAEGDQSGNERFNQD